MMRHKPTAKAGVVLRGEDKSRRNEHLIRVLTVHQFLRKNDRRQMVRIALDGIPPRPLVAEKRYRGRQGESYVYSLPQNPTFAAFIAGLLVRITIGLSD